MRLPQQLIESLWFIYDSPESLILALGERVDHAEKQLIIDLSKLNLPPVTSVEVLGTMIGISPGLIWSFTQNPKRYYRTFSIKKGKGARLITAPKVGLKIIQKWLSFHLHCLDVHLPHVYGFVKGRSHIDAAFSHRAAEWAFSVDIENFFQSTPSLMVSESLQSIGYPPQSASLITSLSCLDDALVQGSPCSPVISNLSFRGKDSELVRIADKYNCTMTRYADDIQFSGQGVQPNGLREDVDLMFLSGPWRLSKSKTMRQPIKGRIKVHGLLVGDNKVRLTKGYRNQIRAYEHILKNKGEMLYSASELRGHVQFKRHVNSRLQSLQSNLAAEGATNDSEAKIQSIGSGLIRYILGIFSRFIGTNLYK